MQTIFTLIIISIKRYIDIISLVRTVVALLITAYFFCENLYAQNISSGSYAYHSFATDIKGQAYAWGKNNQGQLGIGNFTNQYSPINISSSGALANKKIVSVSSGDGHTIALDSDGKVYAWGYNHVGQLGNNTTTSNAVPAAVLNHTGLGQLSNIKAIAAGGYHSLALTNTGEVYIWGFGGNGLGSSVTMTKPVKINALTRIEAIAAGIYHAIALDKDGKVYTWGLGNSGQLGNNTNTSSNKPVLVSGLSSTPVKAIAAGAYHSMALSSDGKVFTWGLNTYGQLGDGTNTSKNIPVLVLNGMKDIVSGGFHSLASRQDGRVYAWGKGDQGQLGNNISYTSSTSYGSNLPVSVSNLLDVNTLAAGIEHSLAVNCNGESFSWGLGGGPIRTTVPVKISNLALGLPSASFEAPAVCAGVKTTINLNFVNTVLNATYEFDYNINDNIAAISVLSSTNSLEHIYAPGAYTARLTTRWGNCESSVVKQIIVNTPPVPGAITGAPTAPILINTPVNLQATLTDATDISANSTKAGWNWGDGSTPVPGSINGSAITGSHLYSTPGVYTIELNVEDACGQKAEAIHKYVVVYDPTVGTVAGLGLFNSNAANMANQTSGIATFGFIAQYTADLQGPEGSTFFLLNLNNLIFLSTDYEENRLVVFGDQANFKGTGRILGDATEYEFLVAAVDGKLPSGQGDKFRIKIWVKDSSPEQEIYDTDRGLDENATPTTSIVGDIIINTDANARLSTEPAAAESNSTISVYPNPFSDKFTLEIGGTYKEEVSITVSTIHGQILSKRNIAIPLNGRSILDIHLQNTDPGMYMIQIASGNKIKTLKVIKE